MCCNKLIYPLCLLTLAFLTCLPGHATVVKDTVYSAQKDRVIITYDINYGDRGATIRFLEASKKPGGPNKEKYSKLSEVKVLFFDRTGGYSDNVKFKGKGVKPFRVPANCRYSRSDDGYFLLDDHPSLTFDVENGQKPELNIPIFLAHYEKKKNYEVFSECGPLIIKLYKKTVKKSGGGSTGGSSSGQVSNESQSVEVITTTEEVDGEAYSMEEEAMSRISTIRRLLDEQDRLPMSDELKSNIDGLRNIEYKVSQEVRSEISSVLDAYRQKQRELEDNQAADAASAQAAAEEKAKQEALAAKAESDSIAAVQQQEAEKGKKRNIWLAIGAALLAVLGFGGNQVAQHLRNAKNQKGLIEMQQKMVKQAENEAKRRARSYARNKTHQAVGQVKQKGRKAVQNTAQDLGKSIKGKKNNKEGGISI